MRADLHVHTCYSPDSITSLEDVIETARRRGLDKIAVTDHNRLEGALRLREIAPELVIVGEEIRTTEGELLCFFLEEEVPRGLSPEETIARVRDQGGVVGISHPMDQMRREAMGQRALTRIRDQLDCVEVFNARCLLSVDNRRVAAWAAELGLPGTAGSDAHHAIEIGRAYVEMPPFTGGDEFLRKLALGRVRGRLSPLWVHFFSTWAKIRRHLSPLGRRQMAS
jgi:predicted metal-dependent phosphoesterase TrpH